MAHQVPEVNVVRLVHQAALDKMDSLVLLEREVLLDLLEKLVPEVQVERLEHVEVMDSKDFQENQDELESQVCGTMNS